MICVFIILREHPKAHRKWFYGEAGNRTCDPWFSRHMFIPYATAASLSFDFHIHSLLLFIIPNLKVLRSQILLVCLLTDLSNASEHTPCLHIRLQLFENYLY